MAERFVCAVHGIVPRNEVQDSGECGRVHIVPVTQPHALDTGEPCYAIGLPSTDLTVTFRVLDDEPGRVAGPGAGQEA